MSSDLIGASPTRLPLVAPPGPLPPLWTDELTRKALQLIADGITALAGFDVAAVSVVRPRGQLRVMAVAGNEGARTALDNMSIPVAPVLAELDRAEDWGRFKFVAQERRSSGIDAWAWDPDLESSDDPQAWRTLDLLVAPLYDDEGLLRGLLSIDCPVDGRRPDATHRRLLERFAEQAARALVLAVQRERLAEQVRLLSAARDAVRSLADEPTAGAQLDRLRTSLADCFRARGLWIHVFEDERYGAGLTYTVDGRSQRLAEPLVAAVEAVAVESWTAQETALLGRRPDDAQVLPGTSEQDVGAMSAFMDEVGIATTMFAPLGAGAECLGSLVFTRGAHDPDWSELEIEAALEIGRDLGRSILTARTVEREREAVRELRALDDYKSGLITTLSHELKSPLAAMLGNLELLEEHQRAGSIDPDVDSVISAVGRGASRLVGVVESLLLLARVGDPHSPVKAEPVDLAQVVDEVRGLLPLAAQHRLVVEVDDAEPVLAHGDPSELSTLVGNLVGNAVKYSADDAPVTVELRRADDGVELVCRDQGIGIGDADQARLFEEFFRSEDLDVRREGGTGLGLAIVDRILSRHGGRIQVESALGTGTAFRVWLPSPA